MVLLMEEKKSIGFTLKRLREQAGITQGELSRRSGIERAYISQLESGRQRSISMATAEALAKGLGVPPSSFFEDTSPNPSLKQLLDKFHEQYDLLDVVEIPLRGSVPAGYPALEEEHKDEYVSIPKELLRGASAKVYALRVSGESLKGDGIHTGDIIVVDPDSTEVVNGKIYAIRLENEVAARHLERRDGSLRLYSSNGQYKDIEASQVEILGRVITGGSWKKL